MWRGDSHTHLARAGGMGVENMVEGIDKPYWPRCVFQYWMGMGMVSSRQLGGTKTCHSAKVEGVMGM